MQLAQTLYVALWALYLNLLRSALTSLGIVIGVAAVVAMVALGDGATTQIEHSFANMGANLLMVTTGSSQSAGLAGGAGTLPSLTYEDVQAVADECSAVRYAVPALRQSVQIIAVERNWATSMTGTAPEYTLIRQWPLAEGRMFDTEEVQGGAKVAVLGATVASNLWDEASLSIGQLVRVRQTPFVVVGVLHSKGQSPMGQDYDDTVLIPHTTFQSSIQGSMQQYVSGVMMVSATHQHTMKQAEQQIRSLLRERHQLEEHQEDDFSLRNLTEIAKAQQQSTTVMTTLLAWIAGISLLVGGIGIMNIMLVSVKERTREIGLRMALGATERDILQQFLMEAFVLAGLGGLVGLGLGVVLAWLLAGRLGWPLLLRVETGVLAFGLSLLIGLLFGFYPARQAARLQPIQALRYE